MLETFLHHPVVRALSRFTEAGTEGAPPREARRIRTANWVSLGSVLSSAPYIPVYWWLGMPELAVALVPVLGVNLLVPVAHGRGRTGLAQVLLFTCTTTFVAMFAARMGEASGIQYSLFAASAAAPLIADWRDPRMLLYGVLMPVLGYTVLILTDYDWFGPPVFGPEVLWWFRTGLVYTTFTIVLMAVVYFAHQSERAQAALGTRNEQMQAVLDHVDQGLLVLDQEGRVHAERSARSDAVLGAIEPGERFVAVLARLDPAFAGWWEMSWEQLADGVLPLEMALHQMPDELHRDGAFLHLECRPIHAAGDRWERMLVVVTDRTSEREAEDARAAQEETLGMFRRMVADRQGAVGFLDEGERLVRGIDDPGETSMVHLRRRIHTLKGNAGLFGIRRVSEACHEVEQRMADTGEPPSTADRQAIRAVWDRLRSHVDPLLRGHDRDRLVITEADYQALLGAVRRGDPQDVLEERLLGWLRTPTATFLARVEAQAVALAERLGKAPLTVRVEAGALRLAEETWAPFWSAFAHAVRNALDHGLPPPDERAGELVLGAVLEGARFVVSIRDNGRGMDWEAVRRKAVAQALSAETHDDLVAALFVDGMTTREAATEVSGRGIGMAALKEATEALEGTIEIESATGEGTTLRFCFPQAVLRARSEANRAA